MWEKKIFTTEVEREEVKTTSYNKDWLFIKVGREPKFSNFKNTLWVKTIFKFKLI